MQHTFKLLLGTILLLFICCEAGAAEVLSAIKGKVLTSDGEPAAYVPVQMKNTGRGIITDQNGEFIFKKVKPGQYILQVSLMGYQPVEQEVLVETDKIAFVTLHMQTSSQQMKEVVITGNKNKYKVDNPSSSLRIQTPLVEVAQNIQVVTADVLKDQQAFDMDESITRNVSGAQRIGHWDMYTRINMRGAKLTPMRNGMNVQINEYSPLTEDLSMVERIEFVKGPAGFMLANGEPSGFYNVVTKKPTGDEQKEFTASLGSFQTYRATADIGGRLSKNGRLLYRVNLMGQLKGSHIDYEFNNRYSIVPVLKYLVDDKTAITLEYTHQYLQMNVIGGNYGFSKRGYGDLPLKFTTAEPNFDPTEINDKSLLLIFEHQISPSWKFTAQGAYFHFKQVGQSMWPVGFSETNDSLLQRGINIWDALGINRTGQMFVNGKFTTGPVSHTLLAGLDMKYSDYYASWEQWSELGNANFNVYDPSYGNIALPKWDRSRDIRERGVQYKYGYDAVYLQDELGLFDNRLRLTLAGRYTTNKYSDPYAGSTSDHKFTPRTGLSYSISKNSSVYFVYDQAFLQNTGRDWQGNSFKPLTGENLELGLKKDWLNGKWNSALSVYRITKNNVLVTDYEHPDPVNNQYIYSMQTGQQQIKGVELDVRGEIVRNLGVVLNYAYTDGEITKDTRKEVVGNRVPGSSKHIQNTWLTYSIGSGVLHGLRFSAGYQYQAGRVAGMVYDKSENPLPDYFRLDGGIGYGIDKFSFNLTVNNILDKYLYTGAPSGGLYYWQAEPGRNVRLSAGYKF